MQAIGVGSHNQAAQSGQDAATPPVSPARDGKGDPAPRLPVAPSAEVRWNSPSGLQLRYLGEYIAHFEGPLTVPTPKHLLDLPANNLALARNP
jgi:hypothetical protein